MPTKATTKKATTRKPAAKKAGAKKAEPAAPRLLRRERRNLEVKLSPQDVTERSHELAVTHRQMRELTAEADDWKKAHKAREQEVLGRQGRLADEVETQRTYRDVRVEISAHDDTREAITVRTDTGEIVSRRALEPDEVQRLFDDDPDLPLHTRSAWDLGCEAKGSERENPYGESDARYVHLRDAWDAGRAGKSCPDEPNPFEWGDAVGAFERAKANKGCDKMPCPWPNAESIEAQRFEAGRAKKPDPHPIEADGDA